MNIAVDFDGTLVKWDHKEPGDWEFEWFPNARESMNLLVDVGHEIVIHTCRATWVAAGEHEPMARWLIAEGFDSHVVVATNSVADGYQSQLWTPLHQSVLRSPGARRVGIWKGVGKPVADVYVDDRGMHFGGDWRVTLVQLLSMAGQLVEVKAEA